MPLMERVEQRTREIVEELRADIDFELDDVITRIVGNLPEDYFKSLSRQDQLRQLKALLAMGVCHIEHEIMIRSTDGRHIGVVSRQNYPGLLANILERLPSDRPLVGAKVFTSIDHDFIIDLFEFKVETGEVITSDNSFEVEQTIEKVAQATGKPVSQVQEFVSHYQIDSPILRSAEDVAEHLSVFNEVEKSNDLVVRWANVEDSAINGARVTISTCDSTARDLFQRTAGFMASKTLDIEKADLHDIPTGPDSHIAIASFVVTGSDQMLDRDLSCYLKS